MTKKEKLDEEYWLGRASINSKKSWNETKKASITLEKIYKQANHELQRELADWLQRYQELHNLDSASMKRIMDTKEAANFRYKVKGYIDRINNLGENSPHAKELLKEFDIMSGKIRYQRYEELIAQIKMQSLELTFKTNTMIQQHLEGMFKDNYYREIYEVQKGLEIGTTFNYIDEEQIQRILGTPWNNKHFSSRLWNKVDDMSFNLRKVITGGIMQGKDYRAMTLDLQRFVGGEYWKARRILETESTFALEKSRTEAWKELGIERYVFVATLDNRTSKDCQRLDGKNERLKDKQEGINAPPMHPFCRSVTTPFVSTMKDARRIARDAETGKSYYVPAEMKYDEWAEKYVNKKKRIDSFDKIKHNSEDEIRKYIKEGQNLEIKLSKQVRHLKEDKGYIAGRSYLTISLEDAQKIVDTSAGQGTIMFTGKGIWEYKELISVDKIIGVSIDEFTKVETETNKMIIHYSKEGIHVVPTLRGSGQE